MSPAGTPEEPAAMSLPEETKRKKDPARRKKLLRRMLIFLLIVAAAVWKVMGLLDNSYFVDTFYQIEDEKIQNPMRIVELADLHLNEFGEDNIELVEEIKRLKPDLIAMAGDMINQDDPDTSVVVTLCRQLVDVAPVYFCYGNHEKQVIRVEQTSTLNLELEELGVHVLHNRYETINVNGNIIDIGGLSANPGTMEAEYTQRFWQAYLQTENYHLLLVHYPQYFFSNGELLGTNIDMALCGHLHGGQVIIPGKGGLYHPLEGFFPEHTDGVWQAENTWVVLSRGLGNHNKVPRINNPPELVIVDVY